MYATKDRKNKRYTRKSLEKGHAFRNAKKEKKTADMYDADFGIVDMP